MIFIVVVITFFVILMLGVAIIALTLNRLKLQALAAQNRAEGFHARQQHAVWASATIISVRRASVMEDARGKEKIELTLQVQPAQGEAYATHTTWHADLNTISQLVPGATVSIKIDATDPKVIYPNMTGVEYWV